MENIDLQGFTDQAMEHAQQPRNKGVLPEFNAEGRVTGPCGETMAFWLNVKDDRIQSASFYTTGCGSSLACGSMATCLAKDKPIEDAAALSQQDILDALGGLPPEAGHCALLAANTMKTACEDYLKNQKGD
ncbi:MAG: iron-sulfur cluster assembly scaffold protein [Syntrophales bacterium]|jgi:nitrogen fixation NifU-like protein|nr:iron-sulfur cluster assembly scaffold protein [Syntrophales bacterium]MCK9391947.1 iron-sulfur cluster assembly scaffold protein [Syntrophales bacterium]